MTDIDHTPDPFKNKIDQSIDKLQSQGQEEEEPFFDFCTTYQLEDDIQNNLFNQEFNQPHLRWIFIDERTIKSSHPKNTIPITNEILYAITTRILNKSHIILFIFGTTNSGKSEFAQSIAKYMKSEFYRILHIHIEIHLGFSDADLDDVSPNLGYGHLFLRDESSDVSGEDSGILKEKVGNLVRVIRAHQNSFIYINPDLIEDNMVDYYIRIAGKKRVYYCNDCDIEVLNSVICPECGNTELETIYSKCNIRGIVYYRQKDPLSPRAVFIPLGRMYMSLHTDYAFREEYQEKKDKNIQYIKEHSGLLGVHFNSEHIEKEAQILAQICREKNITTKISMQLALIEYNSQFTIDDGHKMIGGTAKHNKLLFEKTSQLLNAFERDTYNDEDENEEENTSESEDKKFITSNLNNKELIIEGPLQTLIPDIFKYTNDDLFEYIKKHEPRWQNPERDWYIYNESISKRKKQGQLGRQFGIQRREIGNILEKIRGKARKLNPSPEEEGYVSQYKGKMFEEIIKKRLKASNLFSKVKREGGVGEPDILAYTKKGNYLYILSLKNYRLIDDPYYFAVEAFNPEVNRANLQSNDYKVIMIIVIHDIFHNGLFIIPYNYKNPLPLNIYQKDIININYKK